MTTIITAQGPIELAPHRPATIGHNHLADPFEAFKLELDSLFEEAGNFLDGAPITDQRQADDVSAIVNRLHKATADADEYRKAERKPHADAAAAVQEKWLPIIERGKTALATAKAAMTNFLLKQDEEKRAVAEAARLEAERLAAAARTAHASAGTDLSARVDAQTLLKAADDAEKRAVAAEKDKAQAKGGERATTLRTSYAAEITDMTAFARWAWEHRKDEMTAALQAIAFKEARQGPRTIPGLKIETVRKAV